MTTRHISDHRMRIAIVNLTGGGISGGYRKYLRHVIPKMSTNSNVEAILCASPETIDIQEWFEYLPNVDFVNCKQFNKIFYYHDAELNRQLEKFSPDIIFVPVERSFSYKNIPIVKMVQNMEPYTKGIVGNPFFERFKMWLQCVDGKKAVKEADRVIAISKFVYKHLVDNCGIPKVRIGFAYHGIEEMQDDIGVKPDIIEEDWKDNFIFTAGSIRPARGLNDLLMALNNFSAIEPNIVKLVVAGTSGKNMAAYEERLRNWIQMHNLSSSILWAGELNEREMLWCYRNCRAFVMTSRVEACPNIVLESMSNGSICVSTTTAPMPEIYSEAAIYYAPGDSKSLSGAIKTVLAWDNETRKSMSDRAKKRASMFSWDVCAERTVAELAKATRK